MQGTSATVQVARQPIFNPSCEVRAYELLYRGAGAKAASFPDGVRATAEVVACATLDIGLTQLVGEHAAFVNFPCSLLAEPLRFPMDPERIVIEVLEGAQPAAELLQGLARLREARFRIALDDYDLRLHSHVLLDYADIIKVDIQQHTPEELEVCVAALRHRNLQLVAEKVETADEFHRCAALGFDLFQGYFLQRPELFAARRAPSSRLAALQMIIALSDAQVSVSDLEAAVSSDVGLTYRILRCINSSYYRRPREVESLRRAITLLGFEELRRICAVVMLADMDDRPAQVSVQALVRARMCESLSVLAGLDGSDAFFMAGLLSMLDVLLAQSMEEAVLSLPLSDPLRAALVEHSGGPGEAIACAKHYERGNWDEARFRGLSSAQIDTAYTQAVSWADAAWRSLP